MEGLYFAPLPGATIRGVTAANVRVAVENAFSEIGVLDGQLVPEKQFGPAPTLCGGPDADQHARERHAAFRRHVMTSSSTPSAMGG